MKKIITVMLCLLLLTACGSTVQEPPAAPEQQGSEASPTPPAEDNTPTDTVHHVEFNIQIDFATDDFLSTFDLIHEFDYTNLREERYGSPIELFNGDRLVVWANAPLYDFSVISIGHDFLDDELLFIPISRFGMIDELLPGQAYVINSYISMGTLPWSGITFTDEDNRIRYFTLLQDQSDEFPPYRLLEFENRADNLPEGWTPWWEEEDNEQINIDGWIDSAYSSRAAAYLDVINDLIERYGESRVEQSSSGEVLNPGVGVVRLIDFDGDGSHELYVAFSVEDTFWISHQMIYGYDDGLVVLMDKSRVSNPGTDLSPGVRFIHRDGKVYLENVQEIVDGRYDTLIDGKWVTVLTYYYDVWEDDEHLVNGEAETIDELFAAMGMMRSGAVTEIAFAPCCFGQDELEETQRVAQAF